jgi:thermitase
MLAVWLAIAFLWVLHATPVSAAPLEQILIQEPDQTETLLVHFSKDATPESRDAVVAQLGGELIAWMPQIGVAEIRVPVRDDAQSAAVSSVLSPLVTQGTVTFAESDTLVSAAYVPGDPDFSDATMSYGFEQIDALSAWDIVTGSQQVVIAVVDSGIKLDHPEFAGRLVAGYDFINDDEMPDDDSGHGTHVAGIIAAALDNGEGVAGVCPNCTLMPVKVLNEYNLGSWSQLTQGILFAVDNGAHVINLSLGSTVPSETLQVAIDYAVERGVLVVAAAGNNGSDAPFYPAALDGVLAVGATSIGDTRWLKSDYGNYIDMVAPGELIYSTYHDLDNIFQGYTYMSGTSMAAPFVSGVAGLLFSIAPDLTAHDVTEAMILGADDLGPSGWDEQYGYGRINASGALKSPVKSLVKALGESAEPEPQAKIYLPVLSGN